MHPIQPKCGRRASWSFDIKGQGPWINSQGGNTDENVSQIKEMPSGRFRLLFQQFE